MELLVKPEILTSYIYVPTFGNAETVSFYLLHNVSTLNQCREVPSVLKHCAANRKRLSALLNVGPYIYDVSISGFTRSSIYIHDISSLRVNRRW